MLEFFIRQADVSNFISATLFPDMSEINNVDQKYMICADVKQLYASRNYVPSFQINAIHVTGDSESSRDQILAAAVVTKIESLDIDQIPMVFCGSTGEAKLVEAGLQHQKKTFVSLHSRTKTDNVALYKLDSDTANIDELVRALITVLAGERGTNARRITEIILTCDASVVSLIQRFGRLVRDKLGYCGDVVFTITVISDTMENLSVRCAKMFLAVAVHDPRNTIDVLRAPNQVTLTRMVLKKPTSTSKSQRPRAIILPILDLNLIKTETINMSNQINAAVPGKMTTTMKLNIANGEFIRRSGPEPVIIGQKVVLHLASDEPFKIGTFINSIKTNKAASQQKLKQHVLAGDYCLDFKNIQNFWCVTI